MNTTVLKDDIILDLTKKGNISVLRSLYNERSFNCTLRTKIRPDNDEENEFHPYWDTLEMQSSKFGQIKIYVKTFLEGTDMVVDNWHLWFDVTVNERSVIATSSLSPQLKVILYKL